MCRRISGKGFSEEGRWCLCILDFLAVTLWSRLRELRLDCNGSLLEWGSSAIPLSGVGGLVKEQISSLYQHVNGIMVVVLEGRHVARTPLGPNVAR